MALSYFHTASGPDHPERAFAGNIETCWCRLHHHPAWTAVGMAADLATAHDRLALMHAENLSVTAAFDLSCQDLAEDEQQLFRRLGLHPGVDIDAYVAAALAATDLVTARRYLGALYDHYLRSLAASDPPADRDHALRPRISGGGLPGRC